MTKSAMQYKQLAEAERHNREDERIGKTKNVISLVTGLASAAARPITQLFKGKSDLKLDAMKDADKKALFEKLSAEKKDHRLDDADFKIWKRLSKLFDK